MSDLMDFVRMPGNTTDERLAAQIRELAARQRILETVIEDQKRALDETVKVGFALGARSNARAWRFDARMPNTVGNQLSLPERDEAGRWVRWLVGTLTLPIKLVLEPNRQYDLTVVAPKFASEAAYRTLFVRANNQDLPWLTWDGAKRTTIISVGVESLLNLTIAVADAGDADAPFAISLIDLRIR